MAKRTATSNLTRDNWDDEEASEEMGVFKKASPNELKMRNIRRGKRRGDGDSLGPSVFKDFTAFGSSNSSAPPSFSFLTSNSNFSIGSSVSNSDSKKDNLLVESASPMFSFVQSSTEAKPKKSIFPPCTESMDGKDKNGTSGFKFSATNNFSGLLSNKRSIPECPVSGNDKDKNSGSDSSGFKFGGTDKSSASVTNDKNSDKCFDFTKSESASTGLFNFGKSASNPLLKSDDGKTSNTNCTTEKKESFLNNLKLLNINLLDWLKQHLDQNSFIDLTPVFEDYKKHLEEIKNSEDSSQGKNQDRNLCASQGSLSALGPKASTIAPFSFGLTSNANFDKSKIPSKFATNTTLKPIDPNKPTLFQFGSGENTQKDASKGFSFGVAASNFAANQVETITSNDNSDNEVPVYEVNEVKEDDAVYEQKVKLFYKKENNYVDKGVGTLFMKPAGEKTQLIVRALTNLGTILLNILLNESIPTQRVGKNNVLIVCVPNPVIDTNKSTTPVSMLIRVKTAEDADKLLEKINELKMPQNL